MSPETRPRLKRDERRLVIEHAASELLAARGYADTRMLDVAVASGVSRQMLLRHFATKQDLLRALLIRHRDELFGRLQGGMASAGDLTTRIAATLKAWFEYVDANPFAARMLFYDTTGIPEIAALHEQMHVQARALTADLLRAEPELGIPAHDVEAVSELIRAAATGLAVWHSGNVSTSTPEVTRVAVRMICRALGTRLPAD
jgi:AcrR family transcriptional regulator